MDWTTLQIEMLLVSLGRLVLQLEQLEQLEEQQHRPELKDRGDDLINKLLEGYCWLIQLHGVRVTKD